MTQTDDYQLLVIGGGSGGVRAARWAARLGVKVCLIEEAALGGTCVNVGCVPKKLLVYASHVHEELQDAAGLGWTLGERSFDWSTLIAAKNKEILRLNEIYRTMLLGVGVDLVEGRARLLDRHTVEVAGRRLRGETILVCTGGRPVKPNLPGAELSVTSNEAFFLPELPRRVVVVGGGYIAVEFAGIFKGMGSDVTQLYRGDLFLRGFDRDLRAGLALEMRRRGIDLRFGIDPQAITRVDGGLDLTLSSGEHLQTDLVLCAIGRRPNTEGLGLEALGVELDEQGAVVVDPYSRSTVDNICAVGDVTNRLNLTPVALAEGQAFVETVFNNRPTRPDHECVPSAVFSQPSLATVGLSEEAARRRGAPIDVYKTSFRPLKNMLTGREDRTLMKLVVDRESDRVLGAHMLGPEAGEIMQGVAIAVRAGLTKRDFDRTIGIHPTMAEEFVTMRTPEKDPG